MILSPQRSTSILVLALNIFLVATFRPTCWSFGNRLTVGPCLESSYFQSSRFFTLSSIVNDESFATATDAGLLDQNTNDVLDTSLPAIVSPVLSQLYPELLQYKKEYGHANIPLGSEAGRKCNTLRRLRIQEKLSSSDIDLLDSLQFTWHSFEDVYIQQKEHFDDFIRRLREYSAANEGDLSPPKKYPADPELGAWVTAVRRLYGTGEVDASHVQILDEMGFQWNSPRKCGSKFMQQYRSIQERLKSGEKTSVLLSDPSIESWVKAQQQANLSETRKHYMTQIFGNDWNSLGT